MQETLQASFGPNEFLQRTAHFFNPQNIKSRSLAINILKKTNKMDTKKTQLEEFNKTFWHYKPLKINIRDQPNSVADMETFLANSQAIPIKQTKPNNNPQRNVIRVYNSCKSHESIQRQKSVIENHLQKNTKEAIPLNSIFNRTFTKRVQPTRSQHETKLNDDKQFNPYMMQKSNKSSPKHISRGIRVVCNPFLKEVLKKEQKTQDLYYNKQREESKRSFHSINSECSHSTLRPSRSGKSFLLRKPQTKILNRIFSSRSESTN